MTYHALMVLFFLIDLQSDEFFILSGIHIVGDEVERAAGDMGCRHPALPAHHRKNGSREPRMTHRIDANNIEKNGKTVNDPHNIHYKKFHLLGAIGNLMNPLPISVHWCLFVV